MKHKPVDDSKAFHMKNGQVIKTLPELLAAIKKITPDEFNHHITLDRNDFANWIRHVIGHSELADNVEKMKSRYQLVKVLEKAVKADFVTDGGSSLKVAKKTVNQKVAKKRTKKKIERSTATRNTKTTKKSDQVEAFSELIALKLKEIELREQKIIDAESSLEKKFDEVTRYRKFKLEEFVQGLVLGAIIGFIIALTLLQIKG